MNRATMQAKAREVLAARPECKRLVADILEMALCEIQEGSGSEAHECQTAIRDLEEILETGALA